MSPLTSSFARRFAWGIFYTAPAVEYLRSHHYEIHHINGVSMAPALSPDFQNTSNGDWILFRKNVRLSKDHEAEGGSGAPSELERGMIVSFSSPVTGLVAVKRVVALPGDVVKPLRRSGKSILGLEEAQSSQEVTVPFGHVWLEGDQIDRVKCTDSNDYGPVSKSLIDGIAVRILRPSTRKGPISSHGAWEERCRDRIKLNPNQDEVPDEWAII